MAAAAAAAAEVDGTSSGLTAAIFGETSSGSAGGVGGSP